MTILAQTQWDHLPALSVEGVHQRLAIADEIGCGLGNVLVVLNPHKEVERCPASLGNRVAFDSRPSGHCCGAEEQARKPAKHVCGWVTGQRLSVGAPALQRVGTRCPPSVGSFSPNTAQPSSSHWFEVPDKLTC